MMMTRQALQLSLGLWLGLQMCAAPAADEHRAPESRPAARPVPARPAADGRGQILDGRYNHGRYYPPMGAIRPSLPSEYRSYYRGGSPYYFNGGVWYAPRAGGFVVVRPPVGLVISVLPPYYSTVWFGGVPYYYADNVYYTWQPQQNGYAVVDAPDSGGDPNAPPEGVLPQDGPPQGSLPQGGPPPDSEPPPDAGQNDLIMYPKNGQSRDQQAADRFECHGWAKGQTGFDPTQPGGGVSGNADSSRNNYYRAMSACLTARGYQVN